METNPAARLPPLHYLAKDLPEGYGPTPGAQDGNYLLWLFLEAKFPEAGGTFHLYFKNHGVRKDPPGVFLDDFRKFIDQPRFADHPFRAWWDHHLRTALRESDKAGRRQLKKWAFAWNLPTLRDTRWDSHLSSKRPKVKLGASGSAHRNPFDPALGQTCMNRRDKKRSKA